ncbi:hypothetical protein IEQ34_017081 [Dendrobium chrysotoxum]|uniref:Uncharacterized protein n=1 Tax=Dendrobium chrysotoxum TaxID=161865 RepID=A0AAV7G8Z4_DENCH|nr:hypothetical protein IEQ34_017081 [Dendrobium chrysotoxum]
MCRGILCHHVNISFKYPWSPPLYDFISLMCSINNLKVQFEGSMTITPELKRVPLLPVALISGIVKRKSMFLRTRRISYPSDLFDLPPCSFKAILVMAADCFVNKDYEVSG